jgi:imidazolonepropionase-like amidohydrolase
VDSLEHGMGLDPELLPRMAEQGTALTPTLSVITASLARISDEPDSPRRQWYVSGASVHGRLTAAAAEAGVTVLAGTDSRRHGGIAQEIRALADAGVSPHDAIAAASWAARSYLGLPGLVDGAPADVVVFDADPRVDLGQLDKPRAVIIRGRLLHSRASHRASD